MVKLAGYSYPFNMMLMKILFLYQLFLDLLLHHKSKEQYVYWIFKHFEITNAICQRALLCAMILPILYYTKQLCSYMMRKVNTFVQWITSILKLMVKCFNPMFRGIHFAQIRNTIHEKRNHTHRQEGDSYVEHHFTIMHTNVRWRGLAKRRSLRRLFHRKGPLDSQCRGCLRFPHVWSTWIDCN